MSNSISKQKVQSVFPDILGNRNSGVQECDAGMPISRSGERNETSRQAAEKRKSRGGYYTPAAVAAWLVRWSVRTGYDRVLEPSCGDGVFVGIAASRIMKLRKGATDMDSPQLVGVELDGEEARKAVRQAEAMQGGACVDQCDFFAWLDRIPTASFDAIVGNPPFLRYQNFPEPSRSYAMAFMERHGLRPNRLTNMWVPFIVAGTVLLKPGGRLAMVVPAELLQVTYAGQLRRYLAESFERVTIYACNEMFFERAEQEVLLLLADGKSPNPGEGNKCVVSLVETKTVSDLLKIDPGTRKTGRKYVNHNTEKWLKYFLSAVDIDFMRALRASPEIGTLADHGEVDVGIVTGRNSFFFAEPGTG